MKDDQENTKTITTIDFAGERLLPTDRFWQSLFHRIGITEKIFRYFSYDEVFTRVVERDRRDSMRLCIERPDRKMPRLLAVTSPRKPVLHYDDALTLMRRHDGESINYFGGILSSQHIPRSGWSGFAIGPDQFRNRFVMEVPIDGFGQPRIYLSLLRQVCANGAVGYSRAFRSDLRIGQDAPYTLERAMSQFDHDEGFAALRQRFESAQKSWASVSEVRQLERTVMRSAGLKLGSSQTLARLRAVTGDLHAVYGLANIDALSIKRQRILPAACRVYDLINFASEIATHHATGDAQTRLQAWIGTLVSDEYDLEGTAERAPQFRDLFIGVN